MKVSEWICREDCSFRIREGGDPGKIADRVAFIEKTPRIRIRRLFSYHREDSDYMNWASAPFKGYSPDDQESKAWCDNVLPFFGYELP